MHSFGIRQLAGLQQEIIRKHKGFGYCIIFCGTSGSTSWSNTFSEELHCFMIFVVVVCHWRNSACKQGSQMQPVCYKLCCGLKWVTIEAHFPYLYISWDTFSTADPRQKGQLLLFQLRSNWSFTWSLQYGKNKSATSDQFPLFFKGKVLNNHKTVPHWSIPF